MKFQKIIKDKKITQYDLAQILNVTQSLISQWAKGKCKPSILMIPKLSKILNLSLEETLDLFN